MQIASVQYPAQLDTRYADEAENEVPVYTNTRTKVALDAPSAPLPPPPRPKVTKIVFKIN